MKFSGVVKKHLGRGKELGFPTANIDAPKDLENGLYFAWTLVGSDKLPSLLFVGANETFGEQEKVAEVYILDFNGDLYDQQIEVETIKKMREVLKFDSKELLIEQMHKDVAEARELFKRVL